VGKVGEGVDVRRYGDPSLEARALEAAMILVGRNRTRHASNAKIRRLLGRGDTLVPVAGDRVICRRNNHDLGLLNGSSWKVEYCEPNLEAMTAKLEVSSVEDKAWVESTAWLHHFMGREGELSGHQRRDYDEFSYGWAQTVHTAQGSQYDDVLIFDESKAFGKDAKKHLYTAITRAEKTLSVVV
jgi:exodeoxyribonuclease-5